MVVTIREWQHGIPVLQKLCTANTAINRVDVFEVEMAPPLRDCESNCLFNSYLASIFT